MTKPATEHDIWAKQSILDFAPDEASIPAAQKVLKKGGFGTVEATADGKGWWVVCQGITDIYQVSARIEDGEFVCNCTCPSPKYPCKHALALLLYLSEHPEERAEPEAPKYAPSDFEALVRSVFQNPDDDTPRLVFADFLEENNEPDRAALIRLQCEQARVKARSPRAAELKEEVRRLVAKVRREVVEPLPEGVTANFVRGFLHLETDLYIFREVGSLPARFTKLFQDGWVEVVRSGGYFFDTLTDEHTILFSLAAELDFSAHAIRESALVSMATHYADMRRTGRICRVKLSKHNRREFADFLAAQQGEAVSAADNRQAEERLYDRLTLQSLDLLIRAGRLRSARRLVLNGPGGDPGVELLANADLGSVESLTLDWWGTISETGMAMLANSPALANLTAFVMNTTQLTPAGVAALASGTSLGRIQFLDLSRTNFDDAAAVELAKATRFRQLQTLNLRNEQLTPKGIGAILRSPNFPALRTVNLFSRSIPPGEWLPLLLSAACRPELSIQLDEPLLTRRMTADGVRLHIIAPYGFSEAILTGLKDSRAAKRVVGLTVNRVEQVTPEGLAVLEESLSPDVFKELELRDVPLRNEGAEALAQVFRDYRLETLRLPFCRIQASGLAALADSPVLASVKILDLSGNTITRGGADALAKSPQLGNLEKLVLTGQRVGQAERKVLKDRFGTRLEV